MVKDIDDHHNLMNIYEYHDQYKLNYLKMIDMDYKELEFYSTEYLYLFQVIRVV